MGERDGRGRGGGGGDAPGVGVQAGVGPRRAMEEYCLPLAEEAPVRYDDGRGVLQERHILLRLEQTVVHIPHTDGVVVGIEGLIWGILCCPRRPTPKVTA